MIQKQQSSESFLNKLKKWLLVNLAHLVFYILRSTWRFEEAELSSDIQERLKSGSPLVMGHLHEDEWACLGIYAGRKMAVMVSLSQDGSLMTDFLKKLKFRVVRGSSSKRAVAALLELLRVAKREKIPMLSLAVDGPRGPRRQLKVGIIQLAYTLKSPIVFGATRASRAWVFKRAWSRGYLPKPFAKIKLVYSASIPFEEIRIAYEAGDEAIENLRKKLEEKLLSAKTLSKF